MKAYTFVSCLTYTVLMGLFLGTASVAGETEEKKATPAPKVTPVTVVGMIEIETEDADGNVTQVGISDGINTYYVITNDAKGKQLLSKVATKLAVTGTVKKDADDNNILTVTTFAPAKVEKKAKPVEKDDTDEGGNDNNLDW